jgi:hypothetical protein
MSSIFNMCPHTTTYMYLPATRVCVLILPHVHPRVYICVLILLSLHLPMCPHTTISAPASNSHVCVLILLRIHLRVCICVLILVSLHLPATPHTSISAPASHSISAPAYVSSHSYLCTCQPLTLGRVGQNRGVGQKKRLFPIGLALVDDRGRSVSVGGAEE